MPKPPEYYPQHQNDVEQTEKESHKLKTEEETPQNSIAKEPRQEITEMVNEETWQHAKNKMLDMLNRGDIDLWVLGTLAKMRTFNPERFDKEIEITDAIWQKLKAQMEKRKNDSLSSLKYVVNLKEINPKLFEEQTIISEREIQMITQKIKDERYPGKFLVLASEVKDINQNWFDEYMGTSKELQDMWTKIKEYLKKKLKKDTELFVVQSGNAQNIKPEGEPDIIINEEKWKEIKLYLESMEYYNFRTFLTVANGVARLKIEH